MRHRDLRASLHTMLLDAHADELDTTLFVDELGLCGSVRVDVAVVNGTLSGFELKSAADTLRRLPNQVDYYSRVLDFATLVVAENHLERALPVLPDWWGCFVLREERSGVGLDVLRSSSFNPCIDSHALAQLLWRDETLAILDRFDAASGVRSKPKAALWCRLVETLDLDELRLVVRDALKSRPGWRAATTSAQSGRELATSGALSRP